MRSQTWTLRKVPQITAYFWILKVLTTAVGEATSNYSVRQIDRTSRSAWGQSPSPPP
jgi:uncharacterized membrane-anchored protein